ncbi:glucose-6-phosphate dehydrogenase assembly protein OpcA [Rothia aerolata]|uniref:Glucose-6-phosphate dehydrogenase assembly protein OpcA n=1 Tax=Rothia aerolata TaxID=1812262 RepID=A0A917MQJ4_9MICC|nr:glucose-6-phosphate dehydrogenase assembly protein OpcA [Rothia aerolata]GGH57215.1 glucose-6-phosphate dehydrogenase assembly protein OpcA [Rothia aerolata]
MIKKLENTQTIQIEKEVSRLREATGATTSGSVLTLVILADPGHSSAAREAAVRASHEHPCRIIVHVANDPEAEDRLDAELEIGGEAGASELIVLEGWGRAAVPTESLISGLLLPDSPIVAWWPHSVPENPAEHSVGKIAQRRITDSARQADPMPTLAKLSDNYVAGDTDLAWIRLTLWRIQLAAMLDQLPYSPVKRVVVSGSSKSPSVVLLGAWLGHKLQAKVSLSTTSAERGLYRVVLEREDGDIVIDRPGHNIATVSSPDTPDQQIALPVRTLAECLAEELRRLDPDEVYGEVMTEALPAGNIVVDLSENDTFDEGIEFTEVFDA